MVSATAIISTSSGSRRRREISVFAWIKFKGSRQGEEAYSFSRKQGRATIVSGSVYVSCNHYGVTSLKFLNCLPIHV